MKYFVYLTMFAVMLGSQLGFAGTPVRYEAEWSTDIKAFNGVNYTSDFYALRSNDHTGEWANADLGWTFSHDRAIFLYNTWPLPGQLVEFTFAGTGVTAGLVHYGNGAELNWKIVGAAGNVVSQGTLDLKSDVASEDGDVLAAEGSLPLGLYKVVLDPKEGSAGAVVALDWMDVYGNAIERIEETDSRVAKTGAWSTPNSSLDSWIGGRLLSGRACTMSQTQGDKITLTFNGSDVAVVNVYRSDATDGTVGGTFSWSIDNGAGGSGTIDTSKNQYDGQAFRDVRVSTILAKGLAANTAHTLTCTITSSGKDVRFDAFDVYSPTVPVELSTFSAE